MLAKPITVTNCRFLQRQNPITRSIKMDLDPKNQTRIFKVQFARAIQTISQPKVLDRRNIPVRPWQGRSKWNLHLKSSWPFFLFANKISAKYK